MANAVVIGDYLRTGELATMELEQLLQNHFGSATAVNNFEVHYYRLGQTSPALVLHYSAEHQLTKIEHGPSLLDEDLATLKARVDGHLAESRLSTVHQCIQFSQLVMRGKYQYQDKWLLLPMPQGAPTPEFGIGDHPFRIQFAARRSSDPMINSMRFRQGQREVLLLLSALIPTIKGGLRGSNDHAWCQVMDTASSEWTTRYCLLGFGWNDPEFSPERFSDEGTTPAIPRVATAQIYATQSISVGQELSLPSDFDTLLDIFYSLDQGERERFLCSAFWLQLAPEVSSLSRSAAYTALVSAVEALLPAEVAAPVCPTCNKGMGPGPTRRFIEFTERYAGVDTSRQDRRRLYSLRSALSHGGTLMHSDIHNWSGRMTSKHLSQWQHEMQLRWLVRRVLINWLWSRRQGLSTRES